LLNELIYDEWMNSPGVIGFPAVEAGRTSWNQE